jgi:hypothetical protein
VLFTGNNEAELKQVKECFQAVLDELRNEMLDNGFECKDYSEIVTKSVIKKSGFRPKTLSVLTNEKISNVPHFGSGELERGGFIMKSTFN